MSAVTFIAWVAGILVALTVLPGVFVLARESLRKTLARRETIAHDRARTMLDAVAAQSPESAVKALRQQFDMSTLDRAVESALREAPERLTWIVDASERLGLTRRLLRDLREARAWSDRARAAEALGLLGVPEAGPALVAALRDPHEDALSVKTVAAEALARIRDPVAIPMLVRELHVIDEWSSPRVAEALVHFGESAIPALLELLRDEQHPGAAVWAARILGRIGGTSSTPALLERLRDRQDSMRSAAAEALGAIADKRATHPLIQTALRDPVPQVRASAAGALGLAGDESSADALLAALSDADYATRLRALDALELMRPRNTAPLERALRDPNAEVRRRAALAIERVGYLDARLAELSGDDHTVATRAFDAVLELGRAGLIDSLAGHLNHPDFQVRAFMARACAELGVARVGPLLLLAVTDASWPVRVRVAEALGSLRTPGGAAALASLLHDPEVTVREQAIESLGAFAPEDTLPHHDAIRRVFQHGSARARAHAIEQLGQHERPDTLALLLRAREDPTERVRLRAVERLADVPSPEVTAALVASLGDATLAVRTKAVEALARRAEGDWVAVLLRTLSGAPPELREQIARSLAGGNLEAPVLRERLVALASTADRDVRLGIAWTLGKSGQPEAVPTLVGFLAEEDPALRASAAGALGKIATPASIEALLGAVEDRDARTRAAVVNALGRVGSAADAVMLALIERLNDPDSFVRNRALIAIGRRGGDAAASALEQAASDGVVDASALTVARALSGTPAALTRAAAALADPPQRVSVQRFLSREDDEVRRMFHAQMRLDDDTRAVDFALDERAILDRYHQLLRLSQDPLSRRVAVEALSAFRSEQSLDTLADALCTDPTEEVRLRAARALANAADFETARRALVRAVRDPSPEVATVVIRALGRLRDPKLGDVLFARLGSGATTLDREVEEALAQMFSEAPAAFVDRMMGDGRDAVTLAGLRVLERMGHRTLVPLLQAMLKSREGELRAGAVRALGVVPTREAVASIVGARLDPQEVVRLAVVDALARSEVEGAFDGVLGMVRDPSPEIRARLAARLATVSSPARTDALVGLCDDPVLAVRLAALSALLRIGDAPSFEAFAARWAHASAETRRALRADAGTAALAAVLSDRLANGAEEPVRVAAVIGLSALAFGGVERPLIAAMSDASARVRAVAARALGGLEREGVREALESAVIDPDPSVRKTVVQAIRAMALPRPDERHQRE